jgi:hypothetical protein
MPRPSGNKRDNDFRNEKKNKPSAEKPKRESRESESKRGTRGTSRNAPIRKSEPKATDKPKRAAMENRVADFPEVELKGNSWEDAGPSRHPRKMMDLCASTDFCRMQALLLVAMPTNSSNWDW